MLHTFADGVSAKTRRALPDDQAVMPFGNLRGWDNRIKAHGITGATGDLRSANQGPAPSVPPSPKRYDEYVPPKSADRKATADTPAVETTTQRITAKDIEAGRIRLPARSKYLLPRRRADVDVLLGARELPARWDPRTGPDRERSGVLAFGRGRLDGLVAPDEVLAVTARARGGGPSDEPVSRCRHGPTRGGRARLRRGGSHVRAELGSAGRGPPPLTYLDEAHHLASTFRAALTVAAAKTRPLPEVSESWGVTKLYKGRLDAPVRCEGARSAPLLDNDTTEERAHGTTLATPR